MTSPEPVLASLPEACLGGGGEMGALMRSMDWSRTPLGPVASWPQSLRTAVSIMLESAFGMVVAWGRDFIFLYNDRYRPVLGATKHPGALGQPTRAIFPEAWDFIGPLFERTRRGEAVALDDVPIPLDRNGYLEDCYFTLSYSPIRDESGGVGGMLAVVAETTERVQGERRLATLRDLAALAESRDAEGACSLAERVLSANPIDVPFSLLYLLEPDGQAARLAGATGFAPGAHAAPPRISLDEEQSWPLRDCHAAQAPLVLDDLPVRFGRLPGGAYEESTHTAVVLPMLRAGHERLHGFFVAGVSPRRALDERYRTFFELTRDHIVAAIGNAVAYDEERRRAQALAEIDRAKTAFFSNVSHEFRTPLTLMMGPLEDMLAGVHGTAPEAIREQLELTYRNSLRLMKLVNSLLDFARIEAERVRAAFEPVELAALTAEIAGTFRSAVERAGLRFTVDCEPLPGPVHVDVEMWEKIVLNLVSNALKFTFAGEIAVSLRPRGEVVELEVRDTGTGIPPEELPNLFKRFHRIQGARSRTYEGSGIGLALVQDLLRLHGGDIHCESEVDRGSAFKANIRVGTAHLPADQIGHGRRQSSTRIGADAFVTEATRWVPDAKVARPAAAGGARVLVADDNADMRDYLRRILGERWTVETASNGVEALERARAHPPDLVLTDVMMPGLDGFGLLRALRGDEATRAIPVVMLSARAGEESRIEGLDAGADDYLVKPFSARELVARVKSQLMLAEARRAADDQRKTLYDLFQQAPASVSVVRGPDLVFEMVNDRFLETSGRRREAILGRPALDVFPDLRVQGLDQLMLQVMRSGQPYSGREILVRYDRAGDGAPVDTYWNLVFSPLPDPTGVIDRVMSSGHEVTDLVMARRRLELSAGELARTVAQLDTLLAAVPVGLAFFDDETRFVRINDKLAAWNAVPHAHFLGRRADEVLAPEAAARAAGNIRQVLATRAPVGPLEISAVAPALPGEEKHWLATYFPVHGPGGAVSLVGVVVVDVTGQKRAELERADLLAREREARQEADLQREHLHSLLMQAPTPICILRGPRHLIELANERCCEFWRRASADVFGRPLFEALPELASQGVPGLLSEVLATGEPRLGKETPAELGPVGARRPVYYNFVYAPLRDAASEVEGILVIAFDVTDEVRARDELSRTLRYNEMFAGILGHDLRNPLGSILAAAQLLLRRSSDERITGPARRILSGGERMSRMVDQLLDYTRIRLGGGLAIERRQVDLVEVAHGVLAELEDAMANDRNFQVDVAGDTSGDWDGDRLAQVLSNLAANAVHHGASEGPLRLHLDGTSPAAVTITFENGGTIPDDLLPVVFDPFRGNRRGPQKGLGLGLFISREIVVAHGGDMAVQSTTDDGTRFTIYLPRAAPAAS